MIKKAASILIMVIVITSFLATTVLGYEDDEVISSVGSIINGTYYQDADVSETALGDITADAVRYSSGADVAFVNAADLNAVIDAGDITWSSVKNVFTENKQLAVAKVTPEQIWDYLEYSVSHIKVGPDELTDKEASSFDGYLQVSGIKYEFDATAPEMERLYYLFIGDRQVNRHDNSFTVTLCATETMLRGAYGFAAVESEKTDITLADSLADFLKNGEYTATSISSGRSLVKGTNDHPLVSRWMWLLIGGLFCLSGYLLNKFTNKMAPDRSLNSHIDPNQ